MNRLKNAVRERIPDPVVPLLRPLYRASRSVWDSLDDLAIRLVYRGDSVACPFCRRTFSHFRPTGAHERPFWNSDEGRELLARNDINVANAMCPNCRSGERHRLLYFYIEERIGGERLDGIRLLNIAPDRFIRETVYDRPNLEYVSIDVEDFRDPSVLMDATQLGFRESTFDAVICYHVLEHIPDDRKAMREIYRVMKPSGWAILQVPIWAEETVEDPSVPREEYARVYGHPDHVRRYGFDYPERLASVGFEVTVDDFARTLPRKRVERYGLFPTEDIFYCERPQS